MINAGTASLADYIKIKQDTILKVLMLTIPLFAISLALTFIDFNLLWRYFNWANQVTAVIALLVSTRYLYLKDRNYYVTLLPGVFMLYAVMVYIFSEPIGFGLGLTPISYIGAIIASLIILAVFWETGKKQKTNLSPVDVILNDQLPIETVPYTN